MAVDPSSAEDSNQLIESRNLAFRFPLSAPGSQLPAPSSQLPAPRSQLPAPRSQLLAPSSQLPIESHSPLAPRSFRSAVVSFPSSLYPQFLNHRCFVPKNCVYSIIYTILYYIKYNNNILLFYYLYYILTVFTILTATFSFLWWVGILFCSLLC
jgi:hypothetical protein